MGALDKERIEGRFGPLWSGRDRILVGGRVRTLPEVKRTFDLMTADVVAIDLHELPEGGFAFRFYDGDDRRVVVYVFDAQWEILEEHRAHIAEWLGDVYYDSGALAFDPEAMVLFLKKAQQGGSLPMSFTCRKTAIRESAAQWNLDALVDTPGGDILPCFVSIVSTYCTVQASNTAEGEALLGAVAAALGTPPSSAPQVVKGGSCDGGDDEDAEFPFSGSMVSATWDFPKERKGEILAAVRSLFGLDRGE